jgi:hypothetical protein
MAKRYTDTDKWKKMWFRKLKNDHKVFWMYLLDQCDHAGIWEVDFDLASYFCNGIKESEIRETFIKQYHEFDDGKRWFLKDFIEFQYRGLDESNRVHNSVITILKRHGLYKGLISPLQEAKDKDKDKALDKVKDKDKDKREISKKNQLEIIESELDLLAAEFDKVDVLIEFDKFQDYLKANAKRYANYKSAFRNWLRSDFIKPKETYEKNIYTGSKFES